jgi:O-acetyl-ADP-ribose deacetylase (regulator of RNase III)
LEVIVRSTRIRLVKGDITDQEVDAIVNAANRSLMGGGGVDGAIHRRGGSSILKECKEIRRTLFPQGLPVGKAVFTSGGDLRARYVIHTVGPIWRGGSDEESRLLADAYRNSLRLAVEKGLKTISFPSISTGAYNYPIRDASRIALRTMREFIEQEEGLEGINIILFTEVDFKVYREAMREIFSNQQ